MRVKHADHLPNMRRLRPFLLMEVLVALVITSTVFTFLFGSLRQLHALRSRTQKIRERTLERQFLQLRLTRILGFIQIPQACNQGAGIAPIYLEDHPEHKTPALFLTYHKEIDADPRFIGQVHCVIFCKDGFLRIQTTGPENNQQEENILADSVEFFLYSPEEANWVDVWSKQASDLPPLLKLRLHCREGIVEFGYAVPNGFLPIELLETR